MPAKDNMEQMKKEINLPIRWVGLLLGLFFTGLGQIYNGQLLKGLAFYTIRQFILPLLALTFGLFYSLLGLLSTIIVIFIFHIYTIFDATKKFPKDAIYPKTYNRWYVYVIFIVTTLIIDSYYSDFFKYELASVKNYSIPTSSMHPSIQVGDYIMSDLKALKRPLQRGDIVTYRTRIQANEIEAVSRIVGIPGDTILINKNRVTINGKATTYRDTTDQNGSGLLMETFEGSTAHCISIRINSETSDEIERTGPFIVREKEFFVLGDNRNNAYDSRYIGNISEKQFTGRPIYIYWSQNLKRIGIEF